MLSLISPTDPCDTSAAPAIRSRPEAGLSQGVVPGHSSSVTFRNLSRRAPFRLTGILYPGTVTLRLPSFKTLETYLTLSNMAPLDIPWKQLPVQSQWTTSGCEMGPQLAIKACYFTLYTPAKAFHRQHSMLCRLAQCVF